MPSLVCDYHPYKHQGARYVDEMPNLCLDGPVWIKLLQQIVPKTPDVLESHQTILKAKYKELQLTQNASI